MNVKPLYPNLSRKAITFSIDDGNIPYDKRFIDILAPHGITGTFNLNSDRINKANVDEYRELYRGFEIANHAKRHPKVILPTDAYEYADGKFDFDSADKTKIYKSDVEGLYYKYYTTWWGYVATSDAYKNMIDEGHRELEEIFGEGSVKAFVWPYCRQNDESLLEYLREYGYSSVRRTGEASFDMPKDFFDWSYNAIHTNVLTRAKEFCALADDGSLKFFCLGVHAIDFERAGTWGDLEEFAKTYGDRPEEFFYATVGEIFDYATAFSKLTYKEGVLDNPTDETLYAELDGRAVVIPPKSKLAV